MIRPHIFHAVVLGVIGFLSFVSSANASLMITVTSSLPGGGSLSATDDDLAGDLLSDEPNAVTVSGVLAGYRVRIFTAISNSPGEGGPAGALLSVSTNVQRRPSSGAGSYTGPIPVLTVTVTDTDFKIPSGNNLIMTSGGGGSIQPSGVGDFVNFQSYANTDNQPFSIGSGAVTAGLQVPTPDVNQGMASFDNLAVNIPFSSTGLQGYSLTNVQTIYLSQPNAQGGFIGTTRVTEAAEVPEPATLGLIAACGFALCRPRRK